MKLTEIVQYDSSFASCFCHFQQDALLTGLSPLSAVRPFTLTFLKNRKFFNEFLTSRQSQEIDNVYLLVEKKFFDRLESCPEEMEVLKKTFKGMGTVASVDLAMALLSRPFYEEKYENANSMVDGRQMGTAKVHPSAQISQGVFVGEETVIESDVFIYPGTVIMGHCHIGEGTVVYPNVSVNDGTVIGPRCRIHSGTVIGSDGFGYHFHQGLHHKVWHLGGVRIGRDVEIGANCTIDRGAFKDTVIGDGTKIDNSVQVAHNCQLGKGVILCGQVGLSGSVTIGDYAMFGGQSGVRPGLSVGARSTVVGRSVVLDDWPDGSKIAGYPAMNQRDWLKEIVLRKRRGNASR